MRPVRLRREDGTAPHNTILDILMHPLHPVCCVVPFVFIVFRVTCTFIMSHEPAQEVSSLGVNPFFVQTSIAWWLTAWAEEQLA